MQCIQLRNAAEAQFGIFMNKGCQGGLLHMHRNDPSVLITTCGYVTICESTMNLLQPLNVGRSAKVDGCSQALGGIV